MSSSNFKIFEHTIPCQHIREYPRGTRRRQEEVLHLAIKQYVPPGVDATDENAVTIIATHANGFPKEVYEPLWDDLLQVSRKQGFKIRGIWMADISNQGVSGILNENLQGDDTSYFDHSRDLLHMINTFREQMSRPIIGIGHSFGAPQLVGLSMLHPRLFTSLIFVEPILQPNPPAGTNVALFSSIKQDIWPSFSAASAAVRKTKLHSHLDPRALDNMIKYGLRRIPTAIYPLVEGSNENSYTLATTKHQESWAYGRPNFEGRDPAASKNRIDRLLLPDMNQDHGRLFFYRGEVALAFKYLKNLRPSVLYILGAKSYLWSAENQSTQMARTGVGLGGSGGVKHGQVEQYVFEKGRHLIPLEIVGECADVMGEWMGRKLSEFRKDEEVLRGIDNQKSANDMLVMSKKWLEMVKLPMNEKAKL